MYHNINNNLQVAAQDDISDVVERPQYPSYFEKTHHENIAWYLKYIECPYGNSDSFKFLE